MRIGLIDIIAVGIVVVLLLLPAPERPIEQTYTADTARFLPKIAEAQAEAARRPLSGEAAANLAEVLMWAGQSDWALRAAGAVATVPESKDRWRAALALSKVHAGRIEIDPAYRWALEALAACRETGSTCGQNDRTFIEMRIDGLKACQESGVDPKVDRKQCFDAVRTVVPQIRAPNPNAPVPPTPPPGTTPSPGTTPPPPGQ